MCAKCDRRSHSYKSSTDMSPNTARLCNQGNQQTKRRELTESTWAFKNEIKQLPEGIVKFISQIFSLRFVKSEQCKTVQTSRIRSMCFP